MDGFVDELNRQISNAGTAKPLIGAVNVGNLTAEDIISTDDLRAAFNSKNFTFYTISRKDFGAKCEVYLCVCPPNVHIKDVIKTTCIKPAEIIKKAADFCKKHKLGKYEQFDRSASAYD